MTEPELPVAAKAAPTPEPLELDFDSFFNDSAKAVAAADASSEDITLDELPLPSEPALTTPTADTGKDVAGAANKPAASVSTAKLDSEPAPEFDIYAKADTDFEPEIEPVSARDTVEVSKSTTAADIAMAATASSESANQDATPSNKKPEPTATSQAEPISALDDLALDLPDDWSSLKKAPRQEPVFDDDNGLDLDERSTVEAKSVAKPTPVKAAGVEVNASDKVSLKSATPTVEPKFDTPQHKPAAEKIAAEKTTPKKFGVFKSSSDESFELHPDLAEFSNDDPVIGDWSLNQNETVDTAEEGDQLRQAAPPGPAPVAKKVSDPAATPAAPIKVPAPAVASLKSTDKTESASAAIADFGDISSDWDKPSIQLKNEKVTATAVEPIPEPFDSEAFTADPGSRVFQPVIDPVDNLSIDDWTIASTEPPEDYEAELFAPPPKRKFPWKGLAWTAAALLTLTLLISQLLWPQRGVLREDPQWGPWVENICQHIECNLPPRVDLSKIQLQQKSVLKDRDDPRKLQIDLLIANKAEFSQPYPDIKLRFTNIEAELVAERRFKPAEYLREQPDSDQMPVGVPIHIAFKVMAPDAKVTGYEFDFLPATQ